MARLPEVVADASVVCKWFVQEKGTEDALTLRDAHAEGEVRILSPSLLCYEIVNVLRHHPAMSPERLRSATRAFFDLQLTLVRPMAAALAEAVDFAFREKLTIYDACYAVLAESRSCPLVTEDRGLLRASPRAVPVSRWSPGL